MLELIEEALDEVAFAIERKVARALGLTVGLGWNDRSNVPLGGVSTNGSASYALSPIKASGSAFSINGPAQARS